MPFEWRQDTYVRQDDTQPTTYMVSAATADHPEVAVHFHPLARRWGWTAYSRHGSVVVGAWHPGGDNEAEAMKACEDYYADQTDTG